MTRSDALKNFTVVYDEKIDRKNTTKKRKLKKDGTPKWSGGDHKSGKSSLVYPIKDPDEFKRFANYYKDKIHTEDTNYRRFVDARNHLLITIGNNTAFRISDIVRLRWRDVLGDPEGRLGVSRTQEKKTKKYRSVEMNIMVRDAANLFFEVTNDTEYEVSGDYMNDYVFTTCKSKDTHMTEANALNFVKKAAKACGVTVNVGTHTLRKNFVYWTLMNNKSNPNTLHNLMILLNHSNEGMTLRYATITEEDTSKLYSEIAETYNSVLKGYEDYRYKNKISIGKDYLIDVMKCLRDMTLQDADKDISIHEENFKTIMDMLNEGIL